MEHGSWLGVHREAGHSFVGLGRNDALDSAVSLLWVQKLECEMIESQISLIQPFEYECTEF